MQLRRCHAHIALRSVVRSFSERRALLGDSVVTAPLPARPDQFVEFYLRDRYAVSHDDGPVVEAPEAVVVGPQSYRRTRLFMAGDIHVCTIGFQPGGFHALFGVPMPELVNQGMPIHDVRGTAAAALRDGIMRADDFDARVAIVQRWVRQRMDVAPPVDRVARLAALL